MSEVNFLPPGFVSRRARRRRILREMLLLTAVVVAIPVWFWSTRQDVSALEAYAASLEQQVAAAHEQLGEVTKLSAEQRLLLEQSRTHRELTPALPMYAAIATLCRQMPPGMALRELSMMDESPRAVPAGASTAVPPPLRVILVGIAPAEGEVAEFVARLAESPLSRSVKLAYSKPATQGELIAREFRVELEVPLDREYRRSLPDDARISQEVARAD